MARRPWGTVKQLPSGNWYAQWREGGVRMGKTFATEELANRFLDVRKGILAHQAAGVMPDPRHQPRIGEVVDDFLKRRSETHVAGDLDKSRWKNHMRVFEKMRPSEVTTVTMRSWITACKAKGQSPSSIRVMMSVLSGLFSELQESGIVQTNPVKGLPPSIRMMLRDQFDPLSVPFIEKLEDVRRIYLALPKHAARMYALGAYGGLRPGEARGLDWASVDLERGVIHVLQQLNRKNEPCLLKDRDSRMVPILATLAPLLAEWKLETGGKGWVCRSGNRHRPDAPIDHMAPKKAFPKVLKALGLEREGLTWYGSTRHTFASHWVLRGGNVAQLSKILGHSSLLVTERYLHLKPDLFGDGVTNLFGPAHVPNVCQVVSIADQKARTSSSD